MSEDALAEAIVRIAEAAGAKPITTAMTGPQVLDLAEQTREAVAAMRREQHEMIPPNVNGQYTCVVCHEEWPCPQAAVDAELSHRLVTAQAQLEAVREIITRYREDRQRGLAPAGQHLAEWVWQAATPLTGRIPTKRPCAGNPAHCGRHECCGGA